jgi:ribosomal protein S18 acetylase RimI-like enzyme
MTITGYEHIYANLQEAMRFFGNATGKGEVRVLDEATAIFSGLEYGVFNICLLDAMPRDVATSIASCSKFFRTRSRRWSVWICEDALTADGLRQLKATLAEHNLREISTAPGMVATELTPPRRELPVIQPVAVDSQKLRETFGGLAAVCFDIPIGVSREVYYSERGWNGSYRGYVGMVAGRPVGIMATVRQDETLGIYSLAIQPESRRLGYGEALLRSVVAQAKADAPVERIVLQSSDTAASLYKHIGFQPVTKFSVYLTR